MSTSTPQIILVATDADEVFDGIDAALADSTTQVERVTAGREVLAAVRRLAPALVVLDLQIGNMGGVATWMGLRNEESFGRIELQNILILLDRSADVFIAGRAGADGWLIKPLNSLRLRKAVQQILSGGTYTEGDAEPLETDPVGTAADPVTIETA